MPARFRNWTKQILKGQPDEAAANSTYPYDIPRECVDDIIPVDDASRDGIVDLARRLGFRVFVHEKNRGYGGNQKTCYTEAMKLGADIMSMVHPDHQYDPRVIPGLVTPLLSRECDAVFGSRMLSGRPIEGGMPWWKYLASVPIRFLSSRPTLTSSEDRDILGGEAKMGFRGDAGRVPKPRADKDILILNRDRLTTLCVDNAAENGAPYLQSKRGTF